MKKITILFVFIINMKQLYSQSTFANNNWTTGRFLGYGTTNGANPLLFRTNNLNRMMLNGTTSYTYNGYAGVRNGYLLVGQSIGGNYTGVGPNNGPASLLQLNGTYNTSAQPFLGYRPWM